MMADVDEDVAELFLMEEEVITLSSGDSRRKNADRTHGISLLPIFFHA